MATSSPIAHPVQSLREQVTALEAAITLCLADPQSKPVHKLRTATRRIEAELILLTLLPGLPPHKKAAKKARLLLKELRRAAGEVRDLDVQRELIKERSTEATGAESRRLRRTLKQQRDEAEAGLIVILQKHQAKLARTLESLLEALAPAESLALSVSELMRLTRSWFSETLPTGSKPDDPDRLHSIRKTAKLARYIAETAPKSAGPAQKLASHFEALQQSGGEWHDWLILAEIAKNELGNSRLTQTFRRECHTSLDGYRTRLQSFNLNP